MTTIDPLSRGTRPLTPRGTHTLSTTGELAARATAQAPATNPAQKAGLEVLTDLFQAFGGAQATPISRGLFDLLSMGSLGTESLQHLRANGMGVEELQQGAMALLPSLLGLSQPGMIMASAALALLEEATGLDDLLPSPQLQTHVGNLLVQQLAGTIFPEPGQSAHRQAFNDLLTRGFVDPATGGQLGKGGLQQFGEIIQKSLPLIGELAPQASSNMLMNMLAGVVKETQGPNPTPDSINQAAQQALPRGMQMQQSQGTFAGGTYQTNTVAGTQSGTYSRADAWQDEQGNLHAVAEAGARFEAKAEANAQYRSEHVNIDAHADAKFEAEAKASAGIHQTDKHIEANLYAGVKVRAEANANYRQEVTVIDGVSSTTNVDLQASAEASAEVSATAKAGIDKNGRFELEVGFDAHARAMAEAKAKAKQEFNLFGFKVGVEGYASAKAGAEASAHGLLSYKDGKLTFGGGFGAAAKVGASYGGAVSIQLPPFLAKAVDGIMGVVDKIVPLKDVFKAAMMASPVGAAILGVSSGEGPLGFLKGVLGKKKEEPLVARDGTLLNQRKDEAWSTERKVSGTWGDKRN